MKRLILDSRTHKNIGTSYSPVVITHHNLGCRLNHNLVTYLCFVDYHLKGPLNVDPFLFSDLLLLHKVLHECEALSKLWLQLRYILSNNGYCICCFSLPAVHHDLIAFNLVFDFLCEQIDLLVDVSFHIVLKISCVVLELISEGVHLSSKPLLQVCALYLKCI